MVGHTNLSPQPTLFDRRPGIQMVRITQVIEETPTIRTLRFAAVSEAEAGQFVMVWIPGIDEIPMSISYTGTSMGITVARVGEATEALHLLKNGDLIGIRGPYGRGFRLAGVKRVLVVGGGCGSAPLGPVLDRVQDFQAMKFIVGARTASELLFIDRARRQGIAVEVCTDDGTSGRRGTATDQLLDTLGDESYDIIVSCGPEPMLYQAVKIAASKRVPIQIALERYMRCGIGVCDSCAIDGYRVCRDGPVFDRAILARLSEPGGSERGRPSTYS